MNDTNKHNITKKKYFKTNILKENAGAKWTFGLIKHWYLVNHYLRFVFMIIEC